MAINLAKRMQILRASDIREILKVTQRPEVISFAGGLPAAELFPVSDIRAAADAVLAGKAPEGKQVFSVGCSLKWRPGHAPDYAG